MTEKAPVRHGTLNGYNSRGCRCAACSNKALGYQRDRRAAIKAREGQRQNRPDKSPPSINQHRKEASLKKALRHSLYCIDTACDECVRIEEMLEENDFFGY